MKAPYQGIGADTLPAGALPTAFVKLEEFAHACFYRAFLSYGYGDVADQGCTTAGLPQIAQCLARHYRVQSFDGTRQAQNRAGFAIAPCF
jgi:hypothetical protein